MKTKYEQVAEVIRQQIDSGIYNDNDYLPGERVLSEKLGISRICLRMGLDLLKNSGVIDPVPGKGYLIKMPKHGEKKSRNGFVAAIFAKNEMQRPSSEIIEGILPELENDGLKLVLTNSGLDMTVQRRKLREMASKQIDGILAVPLYIKRNSLEYSAKLGNLKNFRAVQDSGIPVVMIDRPYEPEDAFPCVCNDDFSGGYMAAEYLLKKGHRKIIYLAMASDHIGSLRAKGYSAAMKQYSANPMPCFIRGFDCYGIRYGSVEFLKALWKAMLKYRDYTAVITMGRIVYNFAEIYSQIHSGKKLPEIMGYDIGPSPESHFRYPWVKRPMAEIGRRASMKLLKLINGEKVQKTELIKPVIIVPEKEKQIALFNYV